MELNRNAVYFGVRDSNVVMIARERRPSAVDMVKHDNPAYHVWRIITYKRFYELAFDLGNDKYGI